MLSACAPRAATAGPVDALLQHAAGVKLHAAGARDSMGLYGEIIASLRNEGGGGRLRRVGRRMEGKRLGERERERDGHSGEGGEGGREMERGRERGREGEEGRDGEKGRGRR